MDDGKGGRTAGRKVETERDRARARAIAFACAPVPGRDLTVELRAYRAGRVAWRDIASGIVISDPTGTGHHSYAAAVAREAGWDLVTWDGGAMATGGVAPQSPFEHWRRRAAARPLIVVAASDALGHASLARHQPAAVSGIARQWLAFLDDAPRRPGVVIVATADNIAHVDPVLTRPGRLDRHIHLALPDSRTLVVLLGCCLDLKIEHDPDLDQAVRVLRGRTPAEVAALCRKARRLARWCGRPVSAFDVVEIVMIDRLPLGPDEAETDRRRAAYQAGQAVVCFVLGREPLHSLDLERGCTPPMACRFDTADTIADRLTVLLAGRAAETMVMGQGSNQAAPDLADAARLAFLAQSHWGLGASGLRVAENGDARDSEVGEAVTAMLDAGYRRAWDLLRPYRLPLNRIVGALLAEHYLDASEAESLMRRRAHEPFGF